ncbi:MAG: hypothetical protein E7039_09315 [Lentisphaerae bacterium]|nr:hypothetical protein [Lentisphaerota bacterium]
MNLFDKYYRPYAEYCIRTTLSEDALKEALLKECPSTADTFSWKALKACIGLSNTGVFARNPDNPLQLRPIRASRNTSRGEIFIEFEKVSENATVLHITIAQPQNYKWLLYGICIFAVLWGIGAASVVWWAIFLPLPFIGMLFIVLELCKSMAEDEVPQTRQDFELMLRAWERKSH